MPGTGWTCFATQLNFKGCAAAGIDFAKAKKGGGTPLQRSVAGTDVWSVVDLSSERGHEPNNHGQQEVPPPAAAAITTV